MSQLTPIYSSKHLLAFSKPASVHSVAHPKKPQGDSLAELIAQYFPEQATVSHESGLLNRLDYSTSGIVLAARSAEALTPLKEAFSAQGSEKIYYALVEGELTQEIEIETYLGSRHRSSQKTSVHSLEDNRLSRNAQARKTALFPVEYSRQNNISLIECRIQRGMRHQIRAHAAYAGFPLVGDKLYGASSLLPNISGIFSTPLPADSLRLRDFYLHCVKVEFFCPFTGSKIIVVDALGQEQLP